MTEVSADQLKQTVESQHGGKATLFYVAHVIDTLGAQTVWDGSVHVFDLEGHPEATRAYAWSSLVEGGTERRFHVVLHLGGVMSPSDAVTAAIVAERRAKPA